MCNQILDFYLSHHFMERGWDRNIDKIILYKLLPYVESCKSEKKLVVFTPSFYNAKGVKGKVNQCLVLIIKNKLIITGYWCDNPNYLFKKEREAEFQWLYN